MDEMDEEERIVRIIFEILTDEELEQVRHLLDDETMRELIEEDRAIQGRLRRLRDRRMH